MLLIIFHHTDDIVQCSSAAHWTEVFFEFRGDA